MEGQKVEEAEDHQRHEDAAEARRRGEDGFQFFGYALAHHYIFGEHQPGRTDIWANFERVRATLPPAGANRGLGTPDELRARIAGLEIAPQYCRVIAHTTIPASLGSANVSLIPHDPEAFARALYAELHRCDQPGVRLIVVETPPETAEWAAIRDRLQRAAAV